MPSPSGPISDFPEIPQQQELLAEAVTPFSLEGVIIDVSDFIDAYIIPIMVVVVVLTILRFLYRHYQSQELAIRKFWMFLLFFLSKRLMVVPLVHAFSAKDGGLDEADRRKLLELREECSSVSLRENPTQRLKHEAALSKLLYGYFAVLEKKQQLKSGSKLETVVRDLEFMDDKLVKLQKLYNQSVAQWNDKFSGFQGIVLKLFRFRTFDPFA